MYSEGSGSTVTDLGSGGCIMESQEVQEHVARLRAQGSDDALVEVKSCATELGKSVWESVSAFANTSGGILFLGLDESRGFSLVPDFHIDRVLSQFHDGVSEDSANQKVRPAPTCEIKRVEFEGGQILVITVDEVADKPCYVTARGLENGSYRRVDDKDVRLSTNDIYELKHRTVVSDTDRLAVPGVTLSDLDANELRQYVEMMEREHPRSIAGVTDDAEKLNRLNVTTVSQDITLAALLTLGKYPQQFYPRLTVEVTAYPGSEKSEAGQRVRFADRQICEGRAPELIEQAVQAIRRNLRTVSVIRDIGRQSEPEIPIEVLREAVANAVVHREYDARFVAEPVAVDVYADRVEIRSPGGLWGGKTVQNLSDGNTAQRNQTLMKFLINTPAAQSAGFTVEGAGSGIPLIYNELRSRNMPAPQFKTTPSSVTVIFQRHGLEHLDNREWVEQFLGREASTAEMVAILDVRDSGSVSVDSLRKKLGMDSDDVRSVLASLVDERVLNESQTDVFDVQASSALPTEAEIEVLNAFESGTRLGIQELSAALGKSANTLRPHLRSLVASGYLEAHGSRTSRNRTYSRAELSD